MNEIPSVQYVYIVYTGIYYATLTRDLNDVTEFVSRKKYILTVVFFNFNHAISLIVDTYNVTMHTYIYIARNCILLSRNSEIFLYLIINS